MKEHVGSTANEAAVATIVGKRAHRLPGDRGDERIYNSDGTLVIRAGAPIDGAEPSTHRPTLLLVDDVRWRIVAHTRDGALHVYTLGPWNPGPFEREGPVIVYDPDRVHHARVEQLSLVLRTALLFALLPVAPFFGALPEGTKGWLRDRGLLPPAAQTSSLFVEWVLLYALTGAELICIIASALVPAAVFGLLAIVVMIDIPHRITLMAEGRDVGLLSWPREFIRTLRARAPDDDDDSSRGLPPAL